MSNREASSVYERLHRYWTAYQEGACKSAFAKLLGNRIRSPEKVSKTFLAMLESSWGWKTSEANNRWSSRSRLRHTALYSQTFRYRENIVEKILWHTMTLSFGWASLAVTNAGSTSCSVFRRYRALFTSWLAYSLARKWIRGTQVNLKTRVNQKMKEIYPRNEIFPK